MNKKKVHFLHIGKTGGSAIRSALSNTPETDCCSIKMHHHRVSLHHIPAGEYVVFFLRNPISRFISGFYSRQRKGMPLYNIGWTPEERAIFEVFSTPGQLASALADNRSRNHFLAVNAMNVIFHFSRYSRWYMSYDYFQSRLDDICYIGFQETLDDNFLELKNILGIPESIRLPTDSIASHRSPENLDKSICIEGIAALNRWYSEDIRFIAMCKELMSSWMSGSS